MLTYLSMAEQLKPRWLVWENVPGVLSSNGGKDFGTFLSALGQIGYGFSWRILDAQYFGVAQRRRRVFVVGYLGDWQRAAEVLFEPESLSGNPAPSRETGQKAAPTVTQGAPFSGTGNERVECEAIVPVVASWKPTIGTLMASASTKQWLGNQEALTGDYHILHPVAFSSNMSVPDCQTDGTTPTVKVGGHGGGNPPAVAIQNATRGASGFRWHQGSSAGSIGYQSEQSPTLDTSKEPAVATDMQVRRLTPTECERLQGFPDNYTQIPWRNKTPENCPDGPRYKAMGNSMAVPVMRWIGERIQKIEESYNGKWTQS